MRMSALLLATILFTALKADAQSTPQRFSEREMARKNYIFKCGVPSYGFIIYRDNRSDDVKISLGFYNSHNPRQNWTGVLLNVLKRRDQHIRMNVGTFEGQRHQSSRMDNATSKIFVDLETTDNIRTVYIRDEMINLTINNDQCEQGNQKL